VPDLRILLDPTGIALDEGRKQGVRLERDRIRSQFATYATRHPDPVVADELWGFVHWIDKETHDEQ